MASNPPHLLVVDDEPRIGSFLERALTLEGFRVDVAHDGDGALGLIEQGDYDLVVLDLMMDGMDGWQVLDAVRLRRPELPVVVLSALSDVPARVQSFANGAADYVAKPFALAELVARIRARIRPDVSGVTRHGSLVLDVERRTARNGGEPVHLSEREFSLLSHLVRRAGTACGREEILREVWQTRFDSGTNIVDVCVRRIRQKLGPDAIETVRNAGYRVGTGSR